MKRRASCISRYSPSSLFAVLRIDGGIRNRKHGCPGISTTNQPINLHNPKSVFPRLSNDRVNFRFIAPAYARNFDITPLWGIFLPFTYRHPLDSAQQSWRQLTNLYVLVLPILMTITQKIGGSLDNTESAWYNHLRPTGPSWSS
jgi:hypothetical protein